MQVLAGVHPHPQPNNPVKQEADTIPTLPIGKHKGGQFTAQTYGHDNMIRGVMGAIRSRWEYIAGDLVIGESEKSESRSDDVTKSSGLRLWFSSQLCYSLAVWL